MKKIYFLMIMTFAILLAQQVDIPRVEQMPNLPQPYEMRDWKQVTLGYDSLVFDLTKTGDYLPLIWINTNTVNYPGHNSFGLHTVVGTPYPSNAEGINALPAVISATLVGIDKSNQNGYDWVLGCEEWFNKRPAENVYLNNYVSSSGDDFWYHTMPNVFFYQLYDLYPETGDFAYQFRSVADQWLTAVKTMGGSATPWKKAYMDYRGWYLSTMTPYTSGVKEPEAAGVIAWLLYNAYVKTGEQKYQQGAEWAMEFLSAFPTNAAYELQLPYGVYAAARMNAELNTEYNVEKMLNWCFDPTDNVRGWGVTLGTWGDYDCYGLVGEAANEGYAFAMNGYEMAGALVPMLRYDDRFSRAIGKWVLNLANASRLYYSPFLPDSLQDGEAWAKVYDPNGYIAHESIRETEPNWQVSPFATGDAIAGNWGETNFALYGSSHVGILGGIIDTTNIEGILQLDLLKTDFFRDNAFESYLYYNPHNEVKEVEIEVGWTVVDLYDAVTNQLIANDIAGTGTFTIPPDEARIIVLLPSGSQLTYSLNKTLVGETVIDYSSGNIVDNYPPRIKSLASQFSELQFGEQANIYCTATDREDSDLKYEWVVNGESLENEESTLTWTSPDQAGNYEIISIVKDSQNESVSDTIFINVIESINHVPIIEKMESESSKIGLEESTVIICFASDEDRDSLSFNWSADAGEVTGSDSTITWIAPDIEGNFKILCQVTDGRGGSATDSIIVLVRSESGDDAEPIVYLPFDGSADDLSGYNHNGNIVGAELTSDHRGNANSAYYFDGINDRITITNTNELNFQNGISVSFWMNPMQLFDREAFPISHGSWENRWKISIIPDHRLRWTIKTSAGIKDLDSKLYLQDNTWYHIVALFNGEDVEIYINGDLNSHTSFSGQILTTNFDLTIGQMLPSNTDYNFKGVIDDVRIFDAGISEAQIQNIYNETTDIDDVYENIIPDKYLLEQNYPNPFNPQTVISYQLPESDFVTLEVYNILGEKVAVLVNERQSAGYFKIKWNSINVSSGIYLYKLSTKDYIDIKKCVKLK